MAKTLKNLENVPRKVEELENELDAYKEKRKNILNQYKSEVQKSKDESRARIDALAGSFGLRPLLAKALAVFMVAAYLISSKIPWMLVVAVGAVLLVTSIRPLWWVLYWHYFVAKPEYPSEALREVKSKIKEIEAELSKWDKGLSGECLVASILEQQLPDSYYVINDLVIRAHNRRVQIDHVLVGPAGVVCIETKNITGNFFYDAEGWLRYPAHTIQGIPVRNYRREVIPSPQLQSLEQAQATYYYLNGAGIRVNVYNVVVLTNHAECRWSSPGQGESEVIYVHELPGYIMELPQSGCSPALAQKIITTLLPVKC